MSGAPRSSSLIIPGPVGDLELLIDEPIGGNAVEHVAVICHPHPLFGGNLHNKVAHILARAMNDLGAPAVRFNFRGVGKSAGTHDDGRGEVDDVLSVLDWARQRWPRAQLWLAGFSFGAAMALRASLRTDVARLITVAPALRWLTEMGEQTPACAWLIVQGEQDQLVSAAAVQRWAEALPNRPSVLLLAGAEHFFHGHLNELRVAVKEWLQSAA